MSQPIVSVIVPTKNSQRTLKECLESIKTQSYSPIEIIVVDNFSDDQTIEIARSFTKHVYSRGPERSAQRNFGVDQAKGKYVAIIDSDMRLSSAVIAQCVQQCTSNVTGVIIPEESFGEGFWAQCKRLERSFYLNIAYMEAARFFPRKLFLSLGGYDAAMVSGEDWDLSQRVAQHGQLSRIDAYIYHDEGHISLLKSVGKKYYYAQKFAVYRQRNHQLTVAHQQTGLINRYWLFFSQPKKLFRHPILGVGMLFMKTCEFGFGGAGYVAARLRRNHEA